MILPENNTKGTRGSVRSKSSVRDNYAIFASKNSIRIEYFDLSLMPASCFDLWFSVFRFTVFHSNFLTVSHNLSFFLFTACFVSPRDQFNFTKWRLCTVIRINICTSRYEKLLLYNIYLYLYYWIDYFFFIFFCKFFIKFYKIDYC